MSFDVQYKPKYDFIPEIGKTQTGYFCAVEKDGCIGIAVAYNEAAEGPLTEEWNTSLKELVYDLAMHGMQQASLQLRDYRVRTVIGLYKPMAVNLEGVLKAACVKSTPQPIASRRLFPALNIFTHTPTRWSLGPDQDEKRPTKKSFAGKTTVAELATPVKQQRKGKHE